MDKQLKMIDSRLKPLDNNNSKLYHYDLSQLLILELWEPIGL